MPLSLSLENKAKRYLSKFAFSLISSLAFISTVQAQHVVVIIGARIVDDGASGGGGGGGDGCQWGKKSLELNGVERATAGGNCYTPFPIEFDPNSGRVYAREGSNDARCQADEGLKRVTSKAL